MKTFKQFLIETPLPDEWDGGMYNERISFKKRIEYAKQRAERVGQGSSRVAFKIPYQGRDTVLKIAKNIKGMHQNEAEVGLLNDYYIHQLEIAIPMIDYDDKSNRPTWIHTEFATKAKDSDFIKQTGGTLENFMAYWFRLTNDKFLKYYNGRGDDKIDPDLDLVSAFSNFVASYRKSVPLADFGVIDNWGLYKGRLVIVDLGLSSDIWTQMYDKSRPKY